MVGAIAKDIRCFAEPLLPGRGVTLVPNDILLSLPGLQKQARIVEF